MAKNYLYTTTVEGRGEFPLDMLRYDRCWPKTEDDTSKLRRSSGGLYGAPYQVTLLGNKEPTYGRWQSFGWTVYSWSKQVA